MTRGEFCFIPHFCKCPCHKEIPLKKERMNHYLSVGFPQYIFNHHRIGVPGARRGKPSWNTGLRGKGICKPTPSSFKKGEGSWNKGKHWSEETKRKISISKKEYWEERRKAISVELLKPDITPEIKQVLITEQDKIAIALQRLEEQRKAKIEIFQKEVENRKEEKIKRPFGYIMCISEGKFIQCKKPKAFCSHWEFCHGKVK